jgi:hypothetical protein
MKLPDWLHDLTEDLGVARLAGDITRQEAVTTLRDKIVGQDDRSLIDGVLADFSGRVVDAWYRAHQHAPATGSQAHVQTELFPDLPPRLHIRPGILKAPIDFTAHDWDTAREMVRARTQNAIDGAEADRAQFEAAYAQIRHLLSGSLTTADVADGLVTDGPQLALGGA